MPTISLRAVVALANAAVVAVVTIVTLTITLTLSLRALRSIGATQVDSLSRSTSSLISTYLNRPVLLADGLGNFSRTKKWPQVSRDTNVTYPVWCGSVMNAYFGIADVGTVQLFFTDGTKIGFVPSSNYEGLFIRQAQVLRPNTGGTNGTALAMDYAWYYRANLSLVPSTHPAYTDDFTKPSDPRDGLLQQFEFGTVGGRIKLWLEPTLVDLAGGATAFYSVFAFGLFNGDGTVYAYGLCTIDMATISRFLRDIKSTPNTKAFVVGGDGFLFASTYELDFAHVRRNVPLTEALPSGCTTAATSLVVATSATTRTVMCRKSMSEYGYAPLQATPLPAIDDAAVSVTTVTVDGDNYYSAVMRIPYLGVGSARYLILIMPESDVIGDIVAGRNIAIGACCAMFVIVAVCAAAFIAALLSPLDDISARMLRAASLNDVADGEETELSSLTEVQRIQKAYLDMNDELCRIRSFVPQSLLISRTDQGSAVSETPRSMDAPSSSRRRLSDVDSGAAVPAGGLPPLSASDAASTNPQPIALAPPDQRRTSALRDQRTSSEPDPAQRDDPTADDRRSVESHSSHHRRRRVTWAASVMAQLQSHIGIHVEAVSVLSADLRRFHAVCRALPAEEIESRMRATVDYVYDIASHNGGVLERFNGDHFLITFNAAKRCAEHSVKAATTGVALAQSAPRDGFALSWHIGVASGRAFVGNLGGNSVKAFNVIGSAVTHAVALQNLAKYYNRRSILVPQRLFAELASSGFEVRPLDVLALPGGGSLVIIGEAFTRIAVDANPSRHSPVLVSSPGSSLTSITSKPTTAAAAAPTPSWLYADTDAEISNRDALCHRVFASAASGQADAAKRYFELVAMSFSATAAERSRATKLRRASSSIAASSFAATDPPGDNVSGRDADSGSDTLRLSETTAPADAEAQLHNRASPSGLDSSADLAVVRWELLQFLRYADRLPPRATPPASSGDDGDSDFPLPRAGAGLEPPRALTARPGMPLSELVEWFKFTPTIILYRGLREIVPRVPLMHRIVEECLRGCAGAQLGSYYDMVVASRSPS